MIVNFIKFVPCNEMTVVNQFQMNFLEKNFAFKIEKIINENYDKECFIPVQSLPMLILHWKIIELKHEQSDWTTYHY